MAFTTTCRSSSDFTETLLEHEEPVSSNLPTKVPHQLPAVATPQPTPPEPESVRQLNVLAGAFMSVLSDSMGLGDVITGQVCKDFAERFRNEAAVTGDPVEGLLLGQLVLSNFAIGSLHAKAATATSADDVTAYSGAASRLMAETRRMAESVIDIRRGGKQAVQLAVEQMNVAANGGHQQIAHVANAKKKTSRSQSRK